MCRRQPGIGMWNVSQSIATFSFGSYSNWSLMREMRREMVRFTIKSNSKINLTHHVVLFVIRTSDQKLLFGYATSVTLVHMGDAA